ncbi:hypothetical protein IFT59_18915 [Rhizobium sp. CFBP 8752]|uniref:hypothetical protein n=1 Tax=Rhizobium sp. CFBP 8752 TaxID=2775301 RepID=UPI00178594D8|nr:hypothetical protein [Rhizobium sp. CFBP 8752]MBD8665316.1 hypothetical protein [Rhizobium sp. CFBP 8752]
MAMADEPPSNLDDPTRTPMTGAEQAVLNVRHIEIPTAVVKMTGAPLTVSIVPIPEAERHYITGRTGGPIQTGEQIDEITSIVSARPKPTVAMAAAIVLSLDAELQRLQTVKPNEQVDLARWESYCDFLARLSSQLVQLAGLIEEAEASQSEKPAGFRRVSEFALQVQRGISDWMRVNPRIVEGSREIGLIGLGTAFFAMIGASPDLSLVVSTAVLGQETIPDKIKTIWQSTKED